MDSSKIITAHFISTIAPVVTLTSPTNQAAFGAPATFTIEADASDSDGTVARVEFHVGSDLLATRTQPPFSVEWKDVPVGTYQLTAVAYDNSGLKTTSPMVTIAVNPPAAFHFEQSAYGVGEGDGEATIWVVNDGVQGGTVEYELVPVSAAPGGADYGDYENTSGRLEFANGEPKRAIKVRIRDDYLPEELEVLAGLLVGVQRPRSLNQPDVITRINCDAGHLPKNQPLGHLRPERIDLVARRGRPLLRGHARDAAFGGCQHRKNQEEREPCPAASQERLFHARYFTRCAGQGDRRRAIKSTNTEHTDYERRTRPEAPTARSLND